MLFWGVNLGRYQVKGLKDWQIQNFKEAGC